MSNNQSSIIHCESCGPLPEELAIIEPRQAPSIVEWAPQHLIIPAKESPNLSGLFDWKSSPHLREPCHWFNDPYVRQITLTAGLQRGKSLYMMLCAAWAMVHGIAELFISGRLKPMQTMTRAEREATVASLLKRSLARAPGGLHQVDDFRQHVGRQPIELVEVVAKPSRHLP